MKKIIKFSAIGFGILMVIIVTVAINTPTPKMQSASQPQTQIVKGDSQSAAVVASKSDEDQIKDIVQIQFSNDNASPGESVKSIDVEKQTGNSADPNGFGVFIEYNADKNLTGNLRKEMIEWKMADIYQALYTSHKDIQTVTVAAYLPLEDNYGNVSDGMAYKTMLDESVAQKINWTADKADLEQNILPKNWDVILLLPFMNK